MLRVEIPKQDGLTRQIGVPTLEDKIVQRAAAEVLSAVYETDFLGFSYGFRKCVIRHIKKWLKAGVLEDGNRIEVTKGTPQGVMLPRFSGHLVYAAAANRCA